MGAAPKEDFVSIDVLAKKLGIPTFTQVMKKIGHRITGNSSENDAIMAEALSGQSKDWKLAGIDKGSMFLNDVRRHVYRVRSRSGAVYNFGKSIDKATEMIVNEGCDPGKIPVKMELREDHSTGMINEITWEIPPLETA